MFGSHVPSIDQLVTAVRFRAGHPYWLAHLQDGDTYRHDDGSTLSVEGADDGNWLVYTPPDPMRLRRLDITAVSGSLVLMELALDQTVVTRDTQVRIEADGPWIAVHGGGFSAPASDFSPDSLVPRGELTVELLGLVGSGVVGCGARGSRSGRPFPLRIGIPAHTRWHHHDWRASHNASQRLHS
jgi:hypothetical protein